MTIGPIRASVLIFARLRSLNASCKRMNFIPVILYALITRIPCKYSSILLLARILARI